jgi:glycosyltransferase involved in cell wall biosynthesis
VRAGSEVTVITCAPNFPQGKVYPGYKNKLVQKEMMDGICVIRVWSFITANEGFGMRIADYISFFWSATLAGLFQKADIIVATSPQFFTTLAGFFLSKAKRIPWVFELRDLWPESIRTVGAIKDGKLLRFLEKLELFLYQDSDRVVALTDAFKQNLIARGIAREKIDVVTNGLNLDRFSPRQKDPGLVEALRLQGKFVVGYIGTHGMAHSLEFIVESISRLADPEIRFLFIGDGARKKHLIQMASEKKLQNAIFLDPVSKEEIPRYLSVIDAALVPLKKSETFKTVIPSKIFEAAGMRKPILLGVEGEAEAIIKKYQAGICFEPENEADFLAAVKRLKEDPEICKKLQEGCAGLARNYDRTVLAGRLLNILKQTAASMREKKILERGGQKQ